MLSRFRRRQSKANLAQDKFGSDFSRLDLRNKTSLGNVNFQASALDKKDARSNSIPVRPERPRRPSLRTTYSESFLSFRRPPSTIDSKTRRAHSRRGSINKTSTIGTAYAETLASFPAPIPVTTRPKTSSGISRFGGVNVPTHRTSSANSRPSTARSMKSFDAVSMSPPLPRKSDALARAFNRGLDDNGLAVRPKTPRLEVGLSSSRDSRAGMRLADLPDSPSLRHGHTLGTSIIPKPPTKSPVDDGITAKRLSAEPVPVKSSTPASPGNKRELLTPPDELDGAAVERNRKMVAPLDFRGTLAQRRRGVSVSSIRTVDTSILARTPTAERFTFEDDAVTGPLPLKSPLYLQYTNQSGITEMPNTPALLSAFPQPRNSQLLPPRKPFAKTATPTLNIREPTSNRSEGNSAPVPDTPSLISAFPAPKITVTRESQSLIPRTSARPAENPHSRSSTISRPPPSHNWGWLDLGIDCLERRHTDAGEEKLGDFPGG